MVDVVECVGVFGLVEELLKGVAGAFVGGFVDEVPLVLRDVCAFVSAAATCGEQEDPEDGCCELHPPTIEGTALMSNDVRRDEAQGSTTAVVKWRGNEFTVNRNYDDWTVDFLESLEEGKSVGIVRGALGPAQWRVVKELNLKVRDLSELAEAIAKALGLGSVGESPASSD